MAPNAHKSGKQKFKASRPKFGTMDQIRAKSTELDQQVKRSRQARTEASDDSLYAESASSSEDDEDGQVRKKVGNSKVFHGYGQTVGKAGKVSKRSATEPRTRTQHKKTSTIASGAQEEVHNRTKAQGFLDKLQSEAKLKKESLERKRKAEDDDDENEETKKAKLNDTSV